MALVLPYVYNGTPVSFEIKESVIVFNIDREEYYVNQKNPYYTCDNDAGYVPYEHTYFAFDSFAKYIKSISHTYGIDSFIDYAGIPITYRKLIDEINLVLPYIDKLYSIACLSINEYNEQLNHFNSSIYYQRYICLPDFRQNCIMDEYFKYMYSLIIKAKSIFFEIPISYDYEGFRTAFDKFRDKFIQKYNNYIEYYSFDESFYVGRMAFFEKSINELPEFNSEIIIKSGEKYFAKLVNDHFHAREQYIKMFDERICCSSVISIICDFIGNETRDEPNLLIMPTYVREMAPVIEKSFEFIWHESGREFRREITLNNYKKLTLTQINKLMAILEKPQTILGDPQTILGDSEYFIKKLLEELHTFRHKLIINDFEKRKARILL